MSDNPRRPGDPSDIPSSRSSDANARSARGDDSGHSTNYPSSPSPNTSSPNNHTRNIVLGAIATIVASTTVYYLTQYVNNKKPDSIPNHLVVKEATTNAWKRYVTIDNIYYKNLLTLIKDEELLKNLDNYKTETFSETDNFIKDAEKIIQEKNIDKTFIAIVERRMTREKESKDKTEKLYDNVQSIRASKLSKQELEKKLGAEIITYFQYAKSLFERAATEIEDLTKTLTETYGITFDPYDVMIYADYKKSISLANDNSEEADSDSATDNSPPVNAKLLAGNWNDNGNIINLLQDNTFNYSMLNGERATGTWKTEDNKLRLEGVNSSTRQNILFLFSIKDQTLNSFTMILTTSPYDTYNAIRVKAK